MAVVWSFTKLWKQLQLQSSTHWCCKGWHNHSWIPGSLESSSVWRSCLCQILWEIETKWYRCFQTLSPNWSESLPQSMPESKPGHLITSSQCRPWVDMPWNWVAMEHLISHTQIAEKMKTQHYKGSIRVQMGKKWVNFFPSHLFLQLGLPPSLLFTHFQLSPAYTQLHKSNNQWSGCKTWESKDLCSVPSFAISMTQLPFSIQLSHLIFHLKQSFAPHSSTQFTGALKAFHMLSYGVTFPLVFRRKKSSINKHLQCWGKEKL